MPDVAFIIESEVGKLPTANTPQSLGDECFESFYVLASETSTDIGLNDHFMVVHKKSTVSDTVSYTIKKCGSNTVLPNLGVQLSFPQDDLAYGFVYDCRQYLIAHGAGNYEISKSILAFGQTFDIPEATIKLYPNNEDTRADRFRIRSVFNMQTMYRGDVIDFTGSGAFDTLRLKGRFGNWKANTKTKELVNQNYKSKRVTSINDNTFLLEPAPLKYMENHRLIKLHLFAQNETFITDNNLDNHRIYEEIPVVFVSESLEQDEQGNDQVVTAEFADRYKNQQTRFSKQ